MLICASGGDVRRIGAVRLLNYILGGNLVAPLLEDLPTASLSIPTDLPTLALPSVPLVTDLPLSSILGGLSSELAQLSTAVPLPITSILDGLSSQLAGLSTALPLPTQLPLSSIINGLSTAIPLPTDVTLPLSSGK